MSAKKLYYAQKDFSKERDENYSKKIDEYSSDQKIRILQDTLVFVNALPAETYNKTLQKDIYFGRYGVVTKLILNPPYPNKKGASYQAYATYTSQLDASLAIVALDGYKLTDRALKVSFGTTKYCSHFLRGHQCPNPDCFYLHKLDRNKQVSNGDTRVIFKQQNAKAMDIVCNNFQQVIDRIVSSDIEDIHDGFPSLTELIDYLIDNDYLTQEEVDQAYKIARENNLDQLQVPKLETRVLSMNQPRLQQHDQDNYKLVKSNSHSTMGTPTRQSSISIGDDIFIVVQKKKQDKQLVCSQTKEQKVQIQDRQRTSVTGKQNSVAVRQLKIEEAIQKLIIKQILKKGNNECRSRFVKNATASRQECTKLRGIVQKYLIAHN